MITFSLELRSCSLLYRLIKDLNVGDWGVSIEQTRFLTEYFQKTFIADCRAKDFPKGSHININLIGRVISKNKSPPTLFKRKGTTMQTLDAFMDLFAELGGSQNRTKYKIVRLECVNYLF